MNYTKILISAILMMSAMGATADKLSPDTRIRLQERAKMMTINSAEADEKPSIKVFVAFEPGFNPASLEIEGVEIQSVFDKVATANCTRAAIDALNVMDGVRYIQIASDVKLLNDWGRQDMLVDDVHQGKGTLNQPYTGKGVIVGMIDTGIEYGHHAYYSEDGSELRIRKVWQQNNDTGTAPEGYTYGSELKTASEMLVKAFDTAAEYHGGHTTGTAAGAANKNSLDYFGNPSRFYGMAPDADIVFVSFKSSDNTAIADAIKYIFDYADEQGKPCVINMSLGSHHGPHDGSSYLDQVIDQMTGPGRIIVGACGNEGEARLHATKTFTETDKSMKTMLTFNSQMSHNLHYVDIWGTPGSNLKLSMAIFDSLRGRTIDTSSEIDTSDPNGKQSMYATYLDEVGVDMDAYISYEINPENNAPHIYVQANVSDCGTGRMPGLIVSGDPGATVHMWNEGQHEFSSNGRSGFTNGDYTCSVGEIGGTAKEIITVGSYDGRDRIPFKHYQYYIDMTETSLPYEQYGHSAFSSYGPTADGRTVPHILAPGMPVISALNRYALDASALEENNSDYTTDASGRNYYYVYNMGTSMAAPHVAGVVALMLQANPELTPDQAKQILQETATTTSEMGDLPNNTWGAGRMNALACVQRAVDMNGLQSITDVAVDGDATQVWGEAGAIKVSTPAVGATLRVFTLSGMLLFESELNDTFTSIDASSWGHGIFVAEVAGENARRSFKVAL